MNIRRTGSEDDDISVTTVLARYLKKEGTKVSKQELFRPRNANVESIVSIDATFHELPTFSLKKKLNEFYFRSRNGGTTRSINTGDLDYEEPEEPETFYPDVESNELTFRSQSFQEESVVEENEAEQIVDEHIFEEPLEEEYVEENEMHETMLVDEEPSIIYEEEETYEEFQQEQVVEEQEVEEAVEVSEQEEVEQEVQVEEYEEIERVEYVESTEEEIADAPIREDIYESREEGEIEESEGMCYESRDDEPCYDDEREAAEHFINPAVSADCDERTEEYITQDSSSMDIAKEPSKETEQNKGAFGGMSLSDYIQMRNTKDISDEMSVISFGVSKLKTKERNLYNKILEIQGRRRVMQCDVISE